MFKFSSKTIVNKDLKLRHVLETINASKEAKLDAKVISKICLKNILSPETLNCTSDENIKSLFIFEIDVTERIVPEVFVKEMDKAFNGYTMILIKNEGYTYTMIAYKKGKFYTLNWSNKEDYELPLFTSLTEMYLFIISKFQEYNFRKNESIDDYINRIETIKQLKSKINILTRKRNNEVQSKIKFELNKDIKDLNNNLESLIREDC